MDDLKLCPLCGALPCDWVDDPHKAEVGLCWTLAKIREVLGVGEKPMLGELPDIIATALTAQAAEIARLKAAFRLATDLDAAIFLAAQYTPEQTVGDFFTTSKAVDAFRTFLHQNQHNSNLTGSQSHD